VRRSVFISVALHMAILLWAVAVFPAAKLDAPPVMEIPVEIMNPAEFTKIRAGKLDSDREEPVAKEPEEAETLAVPEPKHAETQTAALPPPPPLPEEAPAPRTEPEPEAPPKPVEAAEPEPKAEKPEKPVEVARPQRKPKPPERAPEKPKPVEAKNPAPDRPSAETQERDFNADRIAALLNKVPDAAPPPSSVSDLLEDAPQEPARGQSDGRDMTMSVNEMDALRARIAQCWSPPPGGLGADAIVVRLRMQLNEDGSLTGLPQVVNSDSSPFFRAAADAAVRAVAQCQPYTLPSGKFALWRDMILNFDPRRMYGG
jgi:outer membrane biosynthesis protein TonB